MQETYPWDYLEDLIAQNAADEIKTYLDELTAQDIVAAVSHLKLDERLKLLTLLRPEDAAGVMEDIPWVQAARLLNELNTREAAAILSEMRSDDQADFLVEMDEEAADAEAIMVEMESGEAENVRKLIQYDPDTAGGLMITEYLAFDESDLVGDVIEDLRENADAYEDYNLQLHLCHSPC